MAYQYFTQLFTGGMNQDVDPAALDLSAQNSTLETVASVSNMFFERGLLYTRLGLSNLPGTISSSIPGTATIRAFSWLPIAARALKSPLYDRGAFCVTDEPALYTFEANQAVGSVFNNVQVTGAGFTQASGYYCDHSMVNGVVMLAGNSTGLVRWDPVGTTYTVVASSPYQYVTGHLARGVAAFDLTEGATGFAQTVAWSVAGDETTWSGIGAGTNVLADCSDSITGLKVVSGVVVVARTYGFHIGIPTGQYPAVYDWRKISDMSIGVMHPATFRVYKNLCFFMSECGIHTFDLVNTADIGEGVYKEINSLIRQYGFVARACISPGYEPDFQPTYNIFLDSAQQLTGTPENFTPHYMYNLREQKWSRHFYTASAPSSAYTPLIVGAEYLPSGYPSDQAAVPFLSVIRRSTSGHQFTLQQWNTGQTLDTAASFTTGQITLQDATQDVQLERLLLIYNIPAFGFGWSIIVTVTAILDGVAVSTSANFSTYTAGGWDRRWLNLRLTGNMMSATVTFAAGMPTPIAVKALVFEYTPVGKVRT